MPRRYTRVIKRAPKKRWASHLEQYAIEQTNYNAATISGDSTSSFYSLAVSTSDTATPTPVVIKTGRFKASIQCFLDLSATGNQNPTNLLVNAYIVYLPQGWPITAGGSAIGYVNQFISMNAMIKGHPEWIIARKQISMWTQTPGAAAGVYDSSTLTISSKLKRNLNSGDQIILVVTAEKISSQAVANQAYTLRAAGQVTYFTTSA